MQGAICFANAAAMDFLGLSYDELSTVYVSDFDRKVICDDGRPCAAGDYPVSRCLATGKPQLPTTLGVQRPDGNTRWGIFSAVPVHDDDERLFGAVVTFIDITERRQTEEALREGEERYRHLVELCPDGILVHTEGNVLFANKALAEILEMKNSSELIGVPVMDIVHPSFRRVVQRRIKELLNGAPAQPWMEQKLVRRNGSAVEIEAAARPFTFKGRHAVQVMLRDITDRKRRDEERDQLFNQVESARARLELLSRRLVDVQEAERRRIARELHDEIGQELT
ncbi:MAG TPA: PAS domain S-box protein, partial [Candidatus Binatia bacterium]|nr:PAS domain S-box protein [Candidatus Binatia bacterium]